jgi:hypothetical protein
MRRLTVLTTTHGQPDGEGTLPLCDLLGFSDDNRYAVVRVSPDAFLQVDGYYPWADVRGEFAGWRRDASGAY